MESLQPLWNDLWNALISTPSSVLIWSLVGFLLFADVVRRTIRWRRLRHVPGPPLAGWTSLWLTSSFFRGGFLEDYEKLAAKYGPVIRVTPNRVLCSDVDALYRISAVRSPYRKDEWYKVSKVSKHGDHTISLLDPEPRRERKKYIGPAYSGRGGVNFEHGADRALAAFIDLIERKYLSTPGHLVPVDFGEKVHYWALDSIGEIAYSSSFGMLDQDRDTYGILAANDGSVGLIKLLSNHTWIWHALHRWPLLYLLPNDGDESGLGAIMGHVRHLVGTRLTAPPQLDMLQSFINHGLRGEDLCQEVGIQFFAGSDTVASLLRTTFLLLLTHPSAYRRLQSSLPPPPAAPTDEKEPDRSIIPDAEAKAIPYLRAVIQEGMRLFPPVAMGAFWKEVPADGDEVCGVRLPRGTVVGTSNGVWVTGRERAFWGGDAATFRPERWLEEKDEARLAQMNRRVELAFGSGQFVCMGRPIALVEAYKALAELFRRYDWSLVNPMQPPTLDNPVTWVTHGLVVKVEKRY